MEKPSFNLWTEPWITVEWDDGRSDTLSLQDTLLQASQLRALYDSSPLVVVGIHRLLTAILQDIFDPQYEENLANIWRVEKFAEDAILQFGAQYAHRFDLFSETEPFMQSADWAINPWVHDDKTPSYAAKLFHEIPDSPDPIHFWHGVETDRVFCSSCAAKGLVTLSAFAKADGRGYKTPPSGMGAIYVLPNGGTLFENLTLSLILPNYQPTIRDTENDHPWWRRSNIVEQGKRLYSLGYLYSLTIPLRKVRLHPERFPNQRCMRCNQEVDWGVITINWTFGENFVNDTEWFDPFSAYTLPKTEKQVPKVISLTEGQALWRDYSTLFLKSKEKTHRQPGVLQQLVHFFDREGIDAESYPVRCISFRVVPRKLNKVSEWLDASFQLPVDLLDDYDTEEKVSNAIDFAEQCANIVDKHFWKAYKGNTQKSKRNKKVKDDMLARYWQGLAIPFLAFVFALLDVDQRETIRLAWLDTVVEHAKSVFREACQYVGGRGEYLLIGVNAQNDCEKDLNSLRKRNK